MLGKLALCLQVMPAGILSALDWLVSVAERVVALGIACVIFYTGLLLVSGVKAVPKPSNIQTTMPRLAAVEILTAVSENWKALLILVIPLFYRTIRGFVERMEEGPFGTKAPLPPVSTKPPVGIPEQSQQGDE
jgi:hypothetical protein